MKHSDSPRIALSEWLSDGVMVHFEGGESVFFSAQFLYEQRKAHVNRTFAADGTELDAQVEDTGTPPRNP